MALYNKYRPQDWDSVCGQEYVTTILRNALIQDRIGHAYLLTGSRGTGKTTTARILAKAINCTDRQNGNPCQQCANCRAADQGTMMDLIEIDAASNNSVDDIRDLIEKSRFEPNQGAYKIYIIDEVHMLSTGAFNALLKTLEDPPPHVKFILATTEIDKVLETIRSRTQRFDFRRIDDADLIARLQYICDQESIVAEPQALALIAKSARGGMRDAITLLEQNITDGAITLDHVRSRLMLIDESRLLSTLESLLSGDIESLLTEITGLRRMHIQARAYVEQMIYFLRDQLFEHLADPSYYEIESIFDIFAQAHGQLRSIPDGMILIETTLLKAMKRGGRVEKVSTPPTPPSGRAPVRESIPTPAPSEKKPTPSVTPELPSESRGVERVTLPLPSSAPLSPPVVPSEAPAQGVTPFVFPRLIEGVKNIKPALSSTLKLARFTVSGSQVTFTFSSAFHTDQFTKNQSNQTAILEALTQTFGGVWSVIYRTDGDPVSTHPLQDDIHEVF